MPVTTRARNRLETAQELRKMHRALTIPELLEIIFSSTDEVTNARAVGVCKAWSGVARDTLWRDVRGLHRLFSLLTPVMRISSQYEFQRPIRPGDWTEFNTLASRVKHLTVEDLYYYKFRESDLGKVATTRPSFHILPNLTQLTLKTSNECQFWFSVIFLHQDLHRLVLQIPNTVVPRDFFTEVSLRCAKLCYLELGMSIPVRKIEAELTDMLPTLRNLKQVVMPCYTISSSIMTALSCLPNLGIVKSQCFEDRECGDPVDVQPFSPVLQEGAFPSLRRLTCDAILSDMSSFLASKFAPVNLTSLCQQTASVETALSVSESLAAIYHTCPRLKFLSLYLTVDGRTQTLNENSDSISFKEVCHILDFPHLVSFELTHYRPLDITDDDIDRLAKNWPSLESLNLNSEPVVLDNPKITFASLASLAQHCPNLCHLGLFLNPSPDDLPKPAVPFRTLKSLDVGTSPIQYQEHAALYLSEICPLSCTLEIGIKSNLVLKNGLMRNADFNSEIRRRQVGWERVQANLPVLTMLRREERERSQDLERTVHDLGRETQDLRMRMKILENLLEDFRTLQKSPGCINK